MGFLSFVRLIGSVFFKKHLAEFILCRPRALYMSLTQNDVDHEQQHSLLKLLGNLQGVGFSVEDELPPSFDGGTC